MVSAVYDCGHAAPLCPQMQNSPSIAVSSRLSRLLWINRSTDLLSLSLDIYVGPLFPIRRRSYTKSSAGLLSLLLVVSGFCSVLKLYVQRPTKIKVNIFKVTFIVFQSFVVEESHPPSSLLYPPRQHVEFPMASWLPIVENKDSRR